MDDTSQHCAHPYKSGLAPPFTPMNGFRSVHPLRAFSSQLLELLERSDDLPDWRPDPPGRETGPSGLQFSTPSRPLVPPYSDDWSEGLDFRTQLLRLF